MGQYPLTGEAAAADAFALLRHNKFPHLGGGVIGTGFQVARGRKSGPFSAREQVCLRRPNFCCAEIDPKIKNQGVE